MNDASSLVAAGRSPGPLPTAIVSSKPGWTRHILPAFAAGLLLGLPPGARTEEAIRADPRGDEETRIREVFSSHLPDTMRASALRLALHPHLGDFTRYDHLRVSTGLRYGVTANWEAGLYSDLYFSHGFGDVKSFTDFGVSSLQPSTKFNLGRNVIRGWDAAIGADLTFPVGRPPPELTDGLRHYEPWITVSRRLESRPAIRIFAGFGSDLVERTTRQGTYTKNQLRDSSLNANAGFVLDRGRLHYSFEASLASTRPLGSARDELLILRPGLVWEIPARHDPSGKTNWIVGGALNTSFGPDGTNIGGSVKVRFNFDLKRLLGRR